MNFEYNNSPDIHKELKAIYGYLSSLEASYDALGLFTKEIQDLIESNKELVECHYRYKTGNPVDETAQYELGSKTFVEKKYQSYLRKLKALEAKRERLILESDELATKVTGLGINIYRNYESRYSMIHMHTDFSTVGNPIPITDDYLPF